MGVLFSLIPLLCYLVDIWMYFLINVLSFYHVFLLTYGQAESEATLKEMRSLRERLNASERAAEGLKSDLSATIAQRDHGQAELHQARLQAAQLTLQLADSSLALREGRARWTQERQSLQRAAEVMCCCRIENLEQRIQNICFVIEFKFLI